MKKTPHELQSFKIQEKDSIGADEARYIINRITMIKSGRKLRIKSESSYAIAIK